MSKSEEFNEQDQANQIKVSIRIRPLRNEFSKRCLLLIDQGVALNYRDKVFPFKFDSVFDESATQENVFSEACKPLLQEVLQGNNASLFVYGQTGTGKTYTMGTLQAIKRQDQGMIPLSLNYLLSSLKNSKAEKDWSISVSFMQIYMEDIFDLLNPRNSKLKIRQDHETGQIYVEDLVIVPISNYKQSIDLINAGLEERKTGNQKMNQLSSRSHTILTVYVSQKISENEYVSSTLSLIDLAGSERVKKTNSTDLRLKQAKFINSSLSALGNVISELALNDSQRFIPFRSSKLTRILKNSLTGRGKVSVICTLEASETNLYETYSTLLFANRCKSIRFAQQPVISIQAFQEMDQQKDLKIELQRSKRKEQQYLQIIKNLEANGKTSSRQSQRQMELSGIIQSIYKLFVQINDHLRKQLDPQYKVQIKKQTPKVTPSVSIPAIKTQITKYAQQTIEKINNLTILAFGEGKSGSNFSGSEAEALLGLLLDNLRQNIKLQQSIFVKDGKQSLQKQIAIEQYEKERKQQILNKLKNKKLNGLVNRLDQIWSQSHASTNPLQSLLNNIRRSEVNYFGDKSQVSVNNNNQFSSPKQFLKMLTRQESQKKHKQIYIEEGKNSQDLNEEVQKNSMAGSQVKYFQNKSSPMRKSQIRRQQIPKEQQKKPVKEVTTGNSEIKKLLQSLIVSKSMHEQKKRGRTQNF